MKKDKKWIKTRHKWITAIIGFFFAPYVRLRYRIRIERFRDKEKRPYLILFNHQTAYDQFFVGISFYPRPLYYVASEDLFSIGWVSSLIRFLVNPIPIKKQTTDVHAVINCIRVMREGGSIAIAPEGNRTYSGKTEYMNPAIAPLVRKLKMPIAIYRIEGGYGVHPRWSDVIRKGKMRAYVARVIEPEEYASMTNDEVHEMIERELFVNEAVVDGVFTHKKSAEYLERALYVCPDCGLSVLESHGDTITCTKCGLSVRYLPTKELDGIGKPFPFRFVADWYAYQCDMVNGLDPMAHTEEPLYRDTASFSEVLVYQKKVPLRETATFSLYGDRIVVDEAGESPLVFAFDEVMALSVLGKNKLNLYHDNRVYQIKGDKRFNALKYVNLFYRYRNVKKGETDSVFLGL